MNMKKDIFCNLPFTEIFLGPNQDIKTCCSAHGELGNLGESTIETILQSKKAKKIRKQFLNNEWPSQCIQCKQQEEQGVRSERNSNKEELLKSTTTLDENTFILRKLDLRWSNTCNLSCVYCYEYFSSKWSEIKQIKINTLNTENEESLFAFIAKNVEQHPLTEGLLLLGGEPLLQKQNLRLIELLQGNGFYILSNLSVPLENNKIAQKLLAEKSTNWGISFETVGPKFEYVRRGASWITFNQNIDYLHKHKKDSSRIEAHSLYSIYSAFNLTEFYEFILDKQFNEVYWNLLESSGNSVNVNVLNLSYKMRQKAIKEIEKCEKEFPSAPGIKSLTSIKNTMIANLDQSTGIDQQVYNDIKDIESKLKNTSLVFENLWPNLFV